MNILFYMHQFPGFGGMETIAATLAKEFVRRGHDVSFLSHQTGNGTSVMTALPECVKCYMMPDSEHLLSEQNRRFLKEIVLRNKIGTILFRDSYAGIEKNVLGCDVPAKVITSEHTCPFYCTMEEHPERFTFFKRLKHGLKYGRLRLPYYYEGRRKRFLYDHSDLYVLLSNRFYGEFKAVARLWDSRKLRAINNPLATECVPDNLNLDTKDNLMVFVATLSEAKGAMRALMALNILKEREEMPSDWRVQILGDGPERGKCEAYIRDHSLDFIEMCGYVSNPQPFFARAKIFLFPSAREGFGNVLFEAQANGCVPVAFSSYSSVFDIVHHGEDGLLVDAFDIERYAAAIGSLVSDDAKRHEMAQNATRSVSRFDVRRIANQWEELFKEVTA
ncbi:MAG: glycosyltransferase [Kiritimatiellia bacterium]